MFKQIYQAADDVWSYMWKVKSDPKKNRPRSATI